MTMRLVIQVLEAEYWYSFQSASTDGPLVFQCISQTVYPTETFRKLYKLWADNGSDFT